MSSDIFGKMAKNMVEEEAGIKTRNQRAAAIEETAVDLETAFFNNQRGIKEQGERAAPPDDDIHKASSVTWDEEATNLSQPHEKWATGTSLFDEGNVYPYSRTRELIPEDYEVLWYSEEHEDQAVKINLLDFLTYMTTEEEEMLARQTDDNTAANTTPRYVGPRAEFKEKLRTHNLKDVKKLRNKFVLIWEKKPPIYLDPSERAPPGELDPEVIAAFGKKRQKVQEEQDVEKKTSPTLYTYLSGFFKIIFPERGGKKKSVTKKRNKKSVTKKRNKKSVTKKRNKKYSTKKRKSIKRK